MEIIQAGKPQVEAIIQCAQAAYQLYIERIGKPPAPMVAPFADLVAQDKVWAAISASGDLKGYIIFYPMDDHVHLENVAVHPDHQGEGVGRALIDFCESHAMAAGFRSIELYTNEKMVENLALYPALGYQQTGRFHQDGFDRVFFKKQLGAG